MEFQVAIKANELLITLSIMEKSPNHDAESKRPDTRDPRVVPFQAASEAGKTNQWGRTPG